MSLIGGWLGSNQTRSNQQQLCFQSAIFVLQRQQPQLLEISLSTQVSTQYIYTFILTYLGVLLRQKSWQKTIRGGNPYNKPYREKTPTTNLTERQPLQQTRSCPSLGGDSVQIKPDQIKVLSPSVQDTTSSEWTISKLKKWRFHQREIFTLQLVQFFFSIAPNTISWGPKSQGLGNEITTTGFSGPFATHQNIREELSTQLVSSDATSSVYSFFALAAYIYAASTTFRAWDTLSFVKDPLCLSWNQSVQSTPIKSPTVGMHPRLCGQVVEPKAQSDRPKPENPTPRSGTYFISENSAPGNTRRAHTDPTSNWSQKYIWARYTGILIPILSLLFTGSRLFLFGSYPPRLR